MAEPASPDNRLRHRDLLADLSAEALRSRDLDHLLTEACRLVADGMGVKFCKVLELLPDKKRLLVRAGVGWEPGVVGSAVLLADDQSPAGHALRTDEPVISNNLPEEKRFRTPELLLRHGIHRAMNVILRGDDDPFGVLEADGREPGAFSPDDVSFLRAAANLLGVAIERGRREAELQREIHQREILMREADHRIKNSLQLVASLLTLQRSRLKLPEAAAALDQAIARVFTVAETHRALLESPDLRTVVLGRMLADICEHLGQLSNTVAIGCTCEAGIEIDAERAIPLGLIVSELLTNAFRHAYPPGVRGMVKVRAERDADAITVTVSDEGVGFDPDTEQEAGAERSLGSTIVQALVRQIKAEFSTSSESGKGSVFTLRLPVQAEA